MPLESTANSVTFLDSGAIKQMRIAKRLDGPGARGVLFDLDQVHVAANSMRVMVS